MEKLSYEELEESVLRMSNQVKELLRLLSEIDTHNDRFIAKHINGKDAVPAPSWGDRVATEVIE